MSSPKKLLKKAEGLLSLAWVYIIVSSLLIIAGWLHRSAGTVGLGVSLAIAAGLLSILSLVLVWKAGRPQ